MSDPDQSKGHRFTKGHKKYGGRQKGSPNKNIREQALAGLARGGLAKARKAGKNGAVDGLIYFFEDLAEKNSSAAAALAGKLISSEPPPATGGYTPPIINVVTVPTNYFLSGEQIEATRRRERVFDPADMTALDLAAPIEQANVIPLRQLTQRSDELAPVRKPTSAEDIEALSMRELASLAAEQLGVTLEDVEAMTMDAVLARLRELSD